MIKTKIVIVGLMVFLSGCGTMKKAKDKTTQRSQTEQTHGSQVERSTESKIERWAADWLQESLLVEALAITDSTIRIAQDQTIEVQGGKIWMRQTADKQKIGAEGSKETNAEHQSETESQRQSQETDYQHQVVSKERDRSSIPIWAIIVLLFVILLSYKQIRRLI